MKKRRILSVILLTVLVSFAGQLEVGGSVPLINWVTSIGAVALPTTTGDNVTIASMAIYNNTFKGFTLSVSFKNGGKFVSADGDTISLTSLKIVPNGTGSLGEGITPLSGKELIPLTNNCFVWKSGDQKTPTCGYGLSVIGSWDASASYGGGLYEETITTTISVSE
jgi:hypothetical protein